jgi:hypothetical protein
MSTVSSLCRWPATLLLLWGLSVPALAEERFALLVGANAGWVDDRPLRDAEQDAERLRQVLVEVGGFEPDRVMVLRDPDTASLRASLRRLSERLRSLGSPASVFFHFGGHLDARGLHLRGKPLSRQELQEALAALPAESRLGVLDVCLPSASRPARTEDSSMQVQTVDAWAERRLGLVIVQGTGPDCGGRRRPDGASFSRHLASGLQGAADEDGDGQVRLSEAARYAVRQLLSDPAQLPPGWGEQEPFLTFPRPGEAGPLSSDPGSEGEALRARRRSEALSLLASGEPASALVLFETLLEEQPGDEAARRGKARALVWLADSYARSGQESLDQDALRAALEAEPSLVEDPDFAPRYRRFLRREAIEQRSTQLEELKRAPDLDSPYAPYTWAVGLELAGTRGVMAPMVLWLPFSTVQFHVALDPLGGQAVDIGGRFQPLYPGYFVGLGYHQPLFGRPRLQWPVLNAEVSTLYARNIHLDLSGQFFLGEALKDLGIFLHGYDLMLEVGIAPVFTLPSESGASASGGVLFSVGLFYFPR